MTEAKRRTEGAAGAGREATERGEPPVMKTRWMRNESTGSVMCGPGGAQRSPGCS